MPTEMRVLEIGRAEVQPAPVRVQVRPEHPDADAVAA